MQSHPFDVFGYGCQKKQIRNTKTMKALNFGGLVADLILLDDDEKGGDLE